MKNKHFLAIWNLWAMKKNKSKFFSERKKTGTGSPAKPLENKAGVTNPPPPPGPKARGWADNIDTTAPRPRKRSNDHNELDDLIPDTQLPDDPAYERRLLLFAVPRAICALGHYHRHDPKQPNLTCPVSLEGDEESGVSEPAQGAKKVVRQRLCGAQIIKTYPADPRAVGQLMELLTPIVSVVLRVKFPDLRGTTRFNAMIAGNNGVQAAVEEADPWRTSQDPKSIRAFTRDKVWGRITSFLRSERTRGLGNMLKWPNVTKNGKFQVDSGMEVQEHLVEREDGDSELRLADVRGLAQARGITSFESSGVDYSQLVEDRNRQAREELQQLQERKMLLQKALGELEEEQRLLILQTFGAFENVYGITGLGVRGLARTLGKHEKQIRRDIQPILKVLLKKMVAYEREQL